MNSITDVAKRAGLSIASVSRVLNGSKPVSDAVRDRVLAAASELNYSADQRAHTLKRRKSKTIGLIVSDAENPFFAQIIRSIENVAYESKHDLFLCNSDEDPERERFHLKAMRAQRIAGIVLLPVCATGAQLAPLIEGTPIVCLDRRLPDVDFDLVIVDNDVGGRLAVEHLLAAGHERIAIITAHDATVSHERLASYRDTLRASGIGNRGDYERRGADAHQETGYDLASALFDLREPPTAIFVTNHLMLLGVIGAARDRGLSIPGDLSLVGFDDTPWAPLLGTPLTTIAQPTRELGATAANLLIDRVDRGYTGPARKILMPPELVVRMSVSHPNGRGGTAAVASSQARKRQTRPSDPRGIGAGRISDGSVG